MKKTMSVKAQFLLMIQKKVTVDKREEMQILCNAEDVELKGVATEKDALVKGVKLDKEVEQEKDVSEAMINADKTKKKKRFI